MVERCADVRARMSAFLDGVLDPAEMQDVMRHVGACTACARVLDEMRAADALLREHSIEPEVEAAARERTVARLHAEPEPSWARGPRRAAPRIQPLRWGIPLATAAAVLVTLRLVLLHPGESPRVQSAPRTAAAPAMPRAGASAPQTAAPLSPPAHARERAASPRPTASRSSRVFALTPAPATPDRATRNDVPSPSNEQPAAAEKSIVLSKAAPEPTTAGDAGARVPSPTQDMQSQPVEVREQTALDSAPEAFRGTTTLDAVRRRVVPLGKTYADTTGTVSSVVRALTQRSAELRRLAPPGTTEERVALAREWTTIAALWEWVARTSRSADEQAAATIKADQALSIAQSLK